jgi:hypothetical protein
MPQFALSCCVSMHTEFIPTVHIVMPAAHRVLHEPITHARPAGQLVPHAPQLALSLCVLAQRAFAPVPQTI